MDFIDNSDVVSPTNFGKVCRTCLNKTQETRNIFESTLNEMLQNFSNVQVEIGDGLPDIVCLQCADFISKAYLFKKQCESNDRILRNNLKEEKSQSEYFTENECDDPDYKYKCDNNSDENDTFNGSKRQSRVKVAQVNKSDNYQERCELCNELLGELDFDHHSKLFHENNVHTCCICRRKSFTDVKALKKHIKQHKPKNYLCTICGKGFYGKSDLTIHIRTHTGEKPFCCNVCEKAFADPRGLTCHMKTHTGEKPYSCDVCGKSFAYSFVLNAHKRVHTAERPFVCSACGKTFVYAGNLTIHTRSHTGERPYSCSSCSKTFTSSSTLSAHKITHTKERRFVCSVCGKKVARSGDLAIHMRTHTGERPYACTLCPKRYRMSCHLTAHMKTHTGEKNHVCDICDQAFTHLPVLKQHLVLHTDEYKYECKTCGKKFKQNSALAYHRKTHHKEKPTSCLNIDSCIFILSNK